MPVKAITMPYLSHVSMTWSSRMEPPGWAMYCHAAAGARARCCRQRGRRRREPRHTPVMRGEPRFLSPQRSAASGLPVKVSFPHAVGRARPSYSSEIYTSMALSRSGRRMSSANGRPSTFGMLAQIPDVRLVARQARAVDAALLAGAHADGLSVLDIADGVGLGVFQGDQGTQSDHALASSGGLCFR